MYHAEVSAETTPQELYDEIAKCYEAGNFPAVDAQGLCQYRMPASCTQERERRACPIGSFIPDDCYSSDMEGSGVSAIIVMANKVRPDALVFPAFALEVFPEISVKNLATALQDLHDRFDWATERSRFLKDVRATFAQYGHDVKAA